MVNKLVGALLLTASFSLCTVHAAVLTWGAPTTVSGDSDVSTNGTLVGAVNLISSALQTKTVNGVSFTNWDASLSPNTSGIFSVSQSSFGAYTFFTNAAPFGGLSADYRDLLRDGGSTPNGGSLTISGLTIGQTYLFQWWSTVPDINPNNPALSSPSTASAGNSVTLDSNVSNIARGSGQFAIGSFTADSATQMVAFGAGSTISAIQVRRTSGSNVPDGGTTLALFGLALVGLVEVRRRLQR